VLAVGLAAVLEGLVILLASQSFAGLRVLFDGYSLPLALLVAVQLAMPVLAALWRTYQYQIEAFLAPNPKPLAISASEQL